MKFDKQEKSGAKKEVSKKKLIIGIIIGVVVLAIIVLPMALEGLK